MKRKWEALGYELRVHASGGGANIEDLTKYGRWWYFRTIAAALAWLDQREREYTETHE